MSLMNLSQGWLIYNYVLIIAVPDIERGGGAEEDADINYEAKSATSSPQFGDLAAGQDNLASRR